MNFCFLFTFFVDFCFCGTSSEGALCSLSLIVSMYCFDVFFQMSFRLIIEPSMNFVRSFCLGTGTNGFKYFHYFSTDFPEMKQQKISK